MSYYTLIRRSKNTGDSGRWGIEFGAYDRADCEGELENWKDQDERYNDKAEYKIIRTNTAKQAEINAKVKELNV